MSQLSEQVLNGLKKAYSAYFDIEEVADGTALKALCAYHNRDRGLGRDVVHAVLQLMGRSGLGVVHTPLWRS